MKKIFLYLLLILTSYSFAQSVNNYKAVIVPIKYSFLNQDNQYRLNTLTKFNLTKAGFIAFYSNETIPSEYNDRCSLLKVDLKEDNSFLATKVFIVFTDCNDKEVFRSAAGRSKQKDFEPSYTEALNMAFQSVYALHYKYNEKSTVNSVEPVAPSVVPIPVPAVVPGVAISNSETKTETNSNNNTLYAQPIANGYQLIDSTPKVIMKVYKTSNANSFVAIKGSLQGVLVEKDKQWFFEYYQNDQLVSEKISVKF